MEQTMRLSISTILYALILSTLCMSSCCVECDVIFPDTVRSISQNDPTNTSLEESASRSPDLDLKVYPPEELFGMSPHSHLVDFNQQGPVPNQGTGNQRIPVINEGAFNQQIPVPNQGTGNQPIQGINQGTFNQPIPVPNQGTGNQRIPVINRGTFNQPIPVQNQGTGNQRIPVINRDTFNQPIPFQNQGTGNQPIQVINEGAFNQQKPGNPGSINPQNIQDIQNPIRPNQNRPAKLPKPEICASNDSFTETISEAIAKLSLEMQKLMVPLKNVIMSPFSISLLLSLLSLGTGGETYNELRAGLHFDHIDHHKEFKKLAEKVFNPNRGITLYSATRLFINSDTSIRKSFTDSAQLYYSAGAQYENFIENPQGAVNNINNWVSKNTAGKIPQLLAGPLNPRTKMIAINTVYFNGAWALPFTTDFTINRNFTTPSGIKSIPFMVQLMQISHVFDRKSNSDIIALFYKGYEFAMLFVIPNGPYSETALDDIENSYDAKRFDCLIKDMEMREASIKIPKMRLKFQTNLIQTLNKLSMGSMFNQRTADFSGLTDSNDVYINSAIHSAVLEITEKGTEAAAVTYVNLDRIGGQKLFTVDRPSLLYIRDMKNHINLFAGKIYDPEPIL